jgi:hypothetical protein
VRRRYGARFEAEDPIEFVRPPGGVGRKVDLPESDAREALDLSEAAIEVLLLRDSSTLLLPAAMRRG